MKPEAREFLARTRVFTEAESEARYHVRVERYVKDIEIEVEALKSLVVSHVLPAAWKQLALLGHAGSGRTVKSSVERLDGAVDLLNGRMNDLQSALERANDGSELEKHARVLAEQVVPAMAALREACDRIEELVADEFWALPKYREMLFLV